jgi:hypothetical protein
MFSILIEQIITLVIYMAIGVLLIKTKVLNQTTLEPISRLVLKLALPLLIFTNTLSGVDRETLLGTLPVLFIAALMYFLLYILMLTLSKLFKLKGDRASVYRALGMFGNVGFMGIPIVSNLYPDRGMLYISIFTIVDMAVLWTLGVKLTSPSTSQNHFNPKKLINPVTVAICLAVFFILVDFQLPKVLLSALTKIGSTSTPLAMIYLGGVFTYLNVGEYLKKAELYGIVLIKMIAFPVLLYWILGFANIAEEIRMTLTFLSAMPSMSSIVMMAKASGTDGDYAMGGIFVTTLSSIISIPLLYEIIRILF